MFDVMKIKFDWPAQFPGKDQPKREREVINEDPRLSLYLYKQLKRRDVFGFGVTRAELARVVREFNKNPRSAMCGLH